MNIVTSLCIDQKDDSFNFQLYHLNNRQKRMTYWKCCITFFATSLRCNPEYKRILYTNDDGDIFHNKINLREFLTQMGVNIIYLPFDEMEKFRSMVKYHFPTLYKFSVIKELAKLEYPSLFLDSDCIWTKPFETEKFDLSRPLIYNVYSKLHIHDKRFNNLSPSEMGTVFKQIEPSYPVSSPCLFGGEILGGTPQVFHKVYTELENYLKNISRQNLNFCFPNGKSIFDGDEYLLSMVYNKFFAEYNSAGGIIKRVWTARRINNIQPQDIDLTIWHVISEKIIGIPKLCERILNKRSGFWSTPISSFHTYLGSYLNIPKRVSKVKYHIEVQIIFQKLFYRLKDLFYRIKFINLFE